MADEDHVEPLLPHGRGRRVTDEEHGGVPGEFGAGEGDHGRGGVHPRHPVSLLGREE